jgi:hypothetical protein
MTTNREGRRFESCRARSFVVTNRTDADFFNKLAPSKKEVWCSYGASIARTKTLKVIQAQTWKVLTAPNTSYGNRR